MGNYALIADVTGYKIDNSVVLSFTPSDNEVNAAINLAEEIVEDITNDIFYEKTEINLFDGESKKTLFFAPEVPYSLISITSCKDVDIDGTVIHTYVENTDFVKYDHYLETAQGWLDRPRMGVFRGGVWGAGQNNIRVEGTWGRSSVPYAIKEATLLLALERLEPGSVRMAAEDVKQVTWSDFTITFLGGVEDRMGKATGFRKVDRLLEKHINYVDLFMVP